MYSTLALGEIVKEETALRKEKEAVCCYVHVQYKLLQCNSVMVGCIRTCTYTCEKGCSKQINVEYTYMYMYIT